ncbi:hypothetical protein [Massilia eurypsychrophila]|uniref:hypothetical protein n=1 Tax=Massilia eurypsychrophila TaxID=1485217 RepID=UPI0010352425|nr:hypothetical protein [Massilia eurypsychrophila]
MRPLHHALLAAAFVAAPACAADLTSYFPASGAAQFLVANFDLASIRSSFGPRRTLEQRTFASLGLVPTKVTQDEIEFDGADWLYSLKVLRRGDLNGDGIEDLEVCFVDKAKGASYNSQQALLVTRYSDSSLAVALRFAVTGCETFAN